MTKKELELELEVLAILVLAAENQKQMLKDNLQFKAKGFLNQSIESGKTVLSLMGFKNKINEDYYAEFTDVIHEQCSEFKKVLTQLKDNESNQNGNAK